MNLAYAELDQTLDAYNAMKADLLNNSNKFYGFVSVYIADITKGDEMLGNGSRFTKPDAVLKYFVQYDDTLTGLEVFNIPSFAPIADINEWKKTKTVA